MKPETKKRMDHLIFMQRLKYGAMAGGIGLVVLSFMLFMGYEQQAQIDKVTATRMVHGTILEANLARSGNASYNLTVRLDDGRSVKMVSQRASGIPYKGEQLDMKEVAHKSGRKNYIVTQLIVKPE